MSTNATNLAATSVATTSDLQVSEFSDYNLIIDARSPHEFLDDHLPGAVNLPVVDDAEYAEVGTKHRSNTHEAYLIGVEYSLRNIARQIRPLISQFNKESRILVYCFRGGKRSKLWADNLRTIGYEVDVLPGGWKSYRAWVRKSLDSLPSAYDFRVISGSTGTGKTRLLKALAAAGEQVLDLEELAAHRGSLIGALPGQEQPSQKLFDTRVLENLRRFDTTAPVWLEAESKKIGRIQLPNALCVSMHASAPIHISAPMAERVCLWREDYRHFVDDPIGMVRNLESLKPLIGGTELLLWQTLAAEGRVDELFERVMSAHYDPCYARSTSRAYGSPVEDRHIHLESLSEDGLRAAAAKLVERFK